MSGAARAVLLQRWFAGTYRLVLRGGAHVTSTAGYRDRLDALLRRSRDR